METPTGLVLSRVLIGVDGSDAAFEACRQIATLAEPDAAIEALSVVRIADVLAEGPPLSEYAEHLSGAAEDALATADELLEGRAKTRTVNGFCATAILTEAERFGATAIALGSHGRRRISELLLGGVAGDVLHAAKCSVLIARPTPESPRFPHAIVVGVDGSAESATALATADRLSRRLDVPLRGVTALGGKSVDLADVFGEVAVEEIDMPPVEALVGATNPADLIVVGSRGLHGLRALGSVSERVAHQASCSVLVVREGPRRHWPAHRMKSLRQTARTRSERTSWTTTEHMGCSTPSESGSSWLSRTTRARLISPHQASTTPQTSPPRSTRANSTKASRMSFASNSLRSIEQTSVSPTAHTGSPSRAVDASRMNASKSGQQPN